MNADPYRGLCLALAVYCDVLKADALTAADWTVLGFDPAEMADKPTAWRLLGIRVRLLIDQAVDEGRKPYVRALDSITTQIEQLHDRLYAAGEVEEAEGVRRVLGILEEIAP